MSTTPKTVVIYHRADFDGIFCREIARQFLPAAEFIGWDYGDPTPAKETLDGTEQLYMLDISVADLMDHPKLIWIDHHKSAIDKFPSTIPGYRIDGVAACRLAWFYFTALERYHRDGGKDMDWFQAHYPWANKSHFVDRKLLEPYAVRLAGEYDIWDKRDPDAELFQHGLRSRELTEGVWKDLLDIESDPQLKGTGMELSNSEAICRTLLQGGYALQYARTHENASIIKELGFTIQFEGLTFLACNAVRYNSHLFTAGLTPEHDACFGFKWTGKDWSVSLYHAPGKEHHDLSLIAVKHGGGGHRGAAGYRTTSLPFITNH